MASVRPPPAPLCACTKEELLRDYEGSKVSDACPLCLSCGLTLAIGLHVIVRPAIFGHGHQPNNMVEGAVEGAPHADVVPAAVGVVSAALEGQSVPPPSQQRSSVWHALPDGRRYRGELVNGKAHGYGTTLDPDGSKYVGSHEGGVRHGHGKWVSSTGACYEGHWQSDVRCGIGRAFDVHGVTFFDGEWKNNAPVTTGGRKR